jgi:hypothetical protein
VGPPSLQFSSGISGLSDAQSAFNRNRTDMVSPSINTRHKNADIPSQAIESHKPFIMN